MYPGITIIMLYRRVLKNFGSFFKFLGPHGPKMTIPLSVRLEKFGNVLKNGVKAERQFFRNFGKQGRKIVRKLKISG